MILSSQAIDELVEVVRLAGSDVIMPRFRNLSDEDVEAKSGPWDLVTVADRAAEDAISQGIAKILPGAAVIGEEAVAASAGLLDAIGTSETCVIVDPIDGTGNYVAGLAIFGTILAVVHKGQVVFGLLYDPVLDDWMFAIRGEGAWYRRRDARCTRISSRNNGHSMDAASGFVALDEYDAEQREIVRRVFEPVFRVRDIRCSCHEYRLLASGDVDFLRSVTLKPWDHAAGLLLLEEAGGWAAVEGLYPYSPTIHDGRIIAAGTEELGHHIANLSAALP